MANHRYLITIVLAWLIAQSIDLTIRTIKSKKFNIRNFFETGGMPSSHTALVVSITTAIGLEDGIKTPLFALALVMSAIVMVDAIKVRYSVGVQADTINEIIKATDAKAKPVRVVRGHTPIEVLAGALIGVAVALAVFFCTCAK
jgi:acid phosphatase family membrane protein YuiD